MKSEYELTYEIRMNTGVLLLLNSPKLMQFGVDLCQWTIGEKFMGIKLIPLGSHFISYALNDEKYQIKQGFFINVNKENKNHVRNNQHNAMQFC